MHLTFRASRWVNTHVIKYTYLTNVQLMGQNSQNYLLLLGTEHLSKHFNYCSIILKTKIPFSLSHSLSFSLKNRKAVLKPITLVCKEEMLSKKSMQNPGKVVMEQTTAAGEK